MADVLRFLLRERPEPVAAQDLSAFWSATAGLRERFPAPVDRALAGGFVSDRLGHAFACGYQAALRALVPSLGPEVVASFCVTEAGGNHPRAILTRVESSADGHVVTGSKRWSTMGPLAQVLVVVATEGVSDDARPKLRAVCIQRDAAGLAVAAMPPPPFVPEVPHAELTLSAVNVRAADVLSGDGYADYTKPFRTVEDLHVQAAVLGYLLSVAARHGFPDAVQERAAALAVVARALAGEDTKSAETHVALAGLLAEIAALSADAEPHWQGVAGEEHARWLRDRGLVAVASRAREQRRERAWEDLRRAGGDAARE